MVSDHILKIVIEAEDRATAALERIESIMKRLGLVGTESFNKASGGSTKFNESVLKANSPLESIQKHLKTVGTTGVQSFNQLSASERKTLLEMSSLSKEAREVMQRLNEVGVTGRNTWNQLSISEQKALTSMNSLSQSTRKESQELEKLMATIPNVSAQMASINKNIVWPELFNTLPKVSAELRTMGNEFNTVSSSSKSKMTSLENLLVNVKEKVNSLGVSAKESLGSKFSGTVTAVKEKVNRLKGSITTASTSMKNLDQSSRTASSGMGFLRSAASMTVGMIGYDLVGAMMEASRESINARGNFDAFGKRLGMNSSELKSFSQECDKMQSSFKKVDMNAVGASALELGVKLKVPKKNMVDLTKMTAVMSSAFVKEGRTQEDAILAVSDAMDGQFRRLQEIGITQDKLKQNGWNGNLQDTESLMNSINTTMEQMGFTETASGIYTLDDAYQALTVSGGRLIGDILIPITPLITGMIDGLIRFIDFLKNLPDGAKIGLIAIAIGVLAGIIYSSLIPAITTLVAEGIPALIAGILGVETTALPLIATVGAIAAAIVLLGGAIYEIGKYFGWWNDLPTMFEAIQAGLTRMWSAFVNNEDVQNIIKGITEGFQWLYQALTPVGQWFMSVLGIVQPAGEEFDIVRAIIDVLGGVFHLLVQHLTNLYNSFMFIVGCVQNTISFFQWLYDVVINIPTAFQNMISFVSVFLSQLPTIVYSYLVSVVRYIVVAGSQWINNAINIARNTVNGVIKWICQLPGRIYSYIVSVGSRILGGGSSWVSNAISLATRTVSAVINNISSLPQKVFNEFMNIGGKINQAINGAVNAAKNFGNNIKNAVLGALGIHSPGIVQNKIATEFENTVGQIDNQISAAQSKANEFGSAILDGFNSNDMNKLNVSPNVNANVGTSIDTAKASTSLNDLIVLNSNAFNNIVSNEQESMNTLTSDVDSNLNNLQLKEQSSLDTMTNHISKSMTKILDKTKSGLKSTTSTTQTNLSKMQNSTAKTTSAMIKAWEGMKNSIVGAAKKIKTNSSTWFDSLSTTISSFYNKLQHPGGAGPRPAGGGTNVKRTTIGSKSPFKKVNSSVVSKKLGIDIEYLGNNTTASNVKGISIMDLVNSIIDGTKGAGSWSNVVNPNVSYIKGKARNWDMKGPKVWGKYPTGLSFKVKEFENNVPNISFNTFKGMAEDVFSACNYDFYYDSEKYGSWQKAFSTGSMNCSDSTDALIWMANQCGLPASKVHGHWNQYGHYWANIAGHKMDTTGWMTRGTWTPSASHAGSPKNEPFENLTQSIKDIATDTNTGEKFDIYTGETVSSEVTVNGELKVIHEFKNLPKGVSAEEVARIVNETTSSDDWQKTLVNSVTFQSEDSKVKTRLQKKQIRARGV